MNTDHYKKKIEEELAAVEKELATVGHKNPDNANDWEATPDEGEILESDDQEVADKITGYEGNTAILKQLEIRYNELTDALGRISDGTYGVCSVGGEPIEEARLEANPAATTCVSHMQ